MRRGCRGCSDLEGGGEGATACVGAYQLELGAHALAEEPVRVVVVVVLLLLATCYLLLATDYLLLTTCCLLLESLSE